jgi:hypothetical protein
MAGGRAARSRPRGGDGIQASRQARTRLALSVGALAAVTGLAAYPALATDGFEQLVGLGGAFAVLALFVALAVGFTSPVPWALVGLGAEYVSWFALREGGVDTRAPLYGAGFLLVAELSYWAIERRSTARAELELDVRRAVTLLVLLAASIGLGTLLLAASSISIGGGVALEALGVVGAVTLLVLVAVLVRRERTREAEA